MNQIVLYGFAPSTYTKTALLVAAELGVDLELKPVALHQPSHYALHPYGKIPILEHGDVTLYETLAIASYLDEDGRLLPEQRADRARALQWITTAIDYAYPALVKSFFVEGELPAEVVTAAAEQLKRLDVGLSKRSWFVGDELCLADLFLYPMVSYALGKLGAQAPSGLASLTAWHDKMQARASVGELA